MPKPPATSEAQLKRQLSWLGEHWEWTMRTLVKERHGLTALDVGCGPGLVMERFSPFLKVTGMDIDPEMVRQVRERGMEAVLGDAQDLPFEDDSFDIVYCAFTMLWLPDRQKAMQEMARVARQCVVCLAEPDYGRRSCWPPEVAQLDEALVRSLRAEGADPFTGRDLDRLMKKAGLQVDHGVYEGNWTGTRLRDEAEAEWETLSRAVKGLVDDERLARTKKAWDAALANDTLVLINPVYHAIGWKR
ncbi:MAG TPA: class I SAM-dependent methyltransferase [Methanomassiliicoccales archaeon]|nr:class I SAM-dependent methyltransferase [Methanomassiliicoccales archaeon]HPR99084.1 class I SAM-dependent methyltransferase [Methanomassiliicoccales archaeon]